MVTLHHQSLVLIATFTLLVIKCSTNIFLEIFLLSIELKVLSYGATISSLKVQDTSGAWREVVPGFDSLEGYLADENRLGTKL